MRRSAKHAAQPVWPIPIALGLICLLGLTSAIVGNGLWDWISWAALVIPLALIGWRLGRQWPRPQRARRSKT